jgi:chemotaxis protein MotB
MAAGGGGAWKVAYADFVTAMMALFMVLWILSQDEKIKGQVEAYFKSRYLIQTKDSPGMMMKGATILEGDRGGQSDLIKTRKSLFDNASALPMDTQLIQRIKDELVRAFIQNPEYRDVKTVEISLSSEGMLIDFFDNPARPLFEKDSSEMTPYGQFVFKTVAWELARYPSTELELEGHTEKNYQSAKPNYTAWEMSVDRASTTRRLLREEGVREPQFRKIAGYAGTIPLQKLSPTDAGNRRVSIKVRAGKTS